MNPPDAAPASLLRQGEGPVFAEPWQAKAFALTLHLHARGVFTWPEWTEIFAAECARAPTGAEAAGYWQAWLRALESLLAQRGVAAAETVAATASRWQEAARATPHGQPIQLENAAEDERGEPGIR